MILNNEQLKELTFKLNDWIKERMVASGGSKAIIGISGGKDSSITAALCVNALGKENVIGVLMPDGLQKDINDALDLCNFLDIAYLVANIETMTNSFLGLLENLDEKLIPSVSNQSKINIPPRVRMTLLYAISQSIDNSRVINTSNISEDWIGFATLYGDTAGAFAPLGMLTSDEVIQLGDFLGLPNKFTHKEPSDGLTGKIDEEAFGFSYKVLNRYIRQGICEDEKTKEEIDKMHRYSRHKFLPIPMFFPGLPIGANDIEGIYSLN